jgi:citronellol/citronellal dehydrogenase
VTYDTDLDLDGEVAIVTGTTRGIGKALALALADRGATVVSTGKTVDDSDADLEGTIHKTAEAVRERGSEALAVQLDVRDTDNCERVVTETVAEFGRVDMLVNNASAIQLAAIADLPVDRFDLLMDVNVRGTYAMTRAALPELRETGGRVLTNAPPLTADPLPGMAPYAFSKLGMTFVTLSLAREETDVTAATVWPVTAIETRATRYFGLGEESDWRTPQVYCDAVLALLERPREEVDGEAFYDEDLLRAAGVEDFGGYAVVEGAEPGPTSAQMFDPSFSRDSRGTR